MAKGLTDDQLKAICDQELRQSIGYGVGRLANQRQKALVYYEGLAKLDLAPPEIEGRSTVVSTDVRNVIQSVLPVLMSKFASGEEIVQAVAKTSAKEQAAQFVTDFMNDLFYNKVEGHHILETAFLDTLISKVGIVKVWWDTRSEETKETYKALDDFELAQLGDDEEIEIVAHDSYVDEEDQEQRQKAIDQLTQQLQQAGQVQPPAQAVQAAQQGNPQAQQSLMQGAQAQQQHLQQIQAQIEQIKATPPKMLHDVDCKRVKKGGKINLVNIPPEEFRISRKARSIADAPMVAHAVRRTLSELKSMGYKNVDMIGSDPSAQIYSAEAVERQSLDDEQPYYVDDSTSIDDSMRVVWVNEVYLRADRDGDGIAELLKITKAGNTLLDCEEVDVAPFVDFHAITTPYRFFGMSVADMAMEPQRIKTNILRAVLDNLSLSVNGRYYAVEGQVNLDDLLSSRPGGIVRIKQPQAVGRLDQGVGNLSDGMSMLEYLQGFTEEATGWQRTANATEDADSLNTTATAANIQVNRAQMRVDLMARNLAEGVVKMFRMMLKLVCQHQDSIQEVRINGAWQQVDPREWANGYDFQINVGLGTGSKEQQVQALQMLMAHQAQVMPMGIANPENVYQAAKKMTEALGFKNSEAFWTDPAKSPPPPPPPNPEMIKAQAQSQIEQSKAQVTVQIEQMKAQIADQQHQREMQRDIEIAKQQQEFQAQQDTIAKRMDMQAAQQQAALDAQEAQAQREHEASIALMKAQAEKERAELDASVKILIAQIGAKQAQDALMVSAQQAADAEVSQEVGGDEASEKADPLANLAAMHGDLMQGVAGIVAHLAKPKQIVRDATGRAIGVQ
jgi:hypothetical protein